MIKYNWSIISRVSMSFIQCINPKKKFLLIFCTIEDSLLNIRLKFIFYVVTHLLRNKTVVSFTSLNRFCRLKFTTYRVFNWAIKLRLLSSSRKDGPLTPYIIDEMVE